MSQNNCSMALSARTSFFDLIAGTIDASCDIVFLLIQLELRKHPTNLAYISSRLRGWPIVLNKSESIWRYPVFALSVTFQFNWKFLRRWCDLLQRKLWALRGNRP